MAVLATLEEAQVLPPEGTREADRIIKSVIQFQSAFTKSPDSSLQEFVRRAVVRKQADRATDILNQFRSHGWTADVLEAIVEAERLMPLAELQALEKGLDQFNLTVKDFQQFMQLVRNGEQALASRGQNFHEVYASHRNAIPGGTGR